MVIAPDNLHGIDKQIKRVQDYLSDSFADIWANTIAVYGRAIETEGTNGKVLEVWTGKKDYKQLFINDKQSAVIGFKVIDRNIDSDRLKATVDIIFSVNVNDVLGTNEYLDEKVLMQAYQMINKCGYTEGVTEIKTGIDNVFAGYYTENIKHRDMAPFHIFSFTTQIEYFASIC